MPTTPSSPAHEREIPPSPGDVPAQVPDGPDAAPLAQPTKRAPARPGGWRRVALRGPVALTAVVLLVALLVALHVRDYTRISPIDELQHLDYALKLGDGELIERGELFGIEAMREEACRGVDAEFRPPPCDQPVLRPEEFQEAGYNTAEPHPPIYYAVEGVGGRLTEALPGIASPVTAARLMGILWLGAAVVLMWFVLAELRVRELVRVLMLVLLACAPTVLHATATVNPDGTALTLGAATLLVVLRWESGRARPWMLAAVGAAAALTKVTNLAGIAVAVLYIAGRWLQRRSTGRRPASGDGVDTAQAGLEPAEDELPDSRARGREALRPSLTAIGALSAAFLVATVGWLAIGVLKAGGDDSESPMAQRFNVDTISLDEVADNVFAGLSPLRDPYLPRELSTPFVRLGGAVIDRLILAGVVAGLLASSAGSRARALGLATFVVMVGLGPFFVIFDFVATSSYFPIPPRYGLSIVPAAAAVGAIALDRTLSGRILLGSGAAVGTVAMLAAMA